MDIIKGENSINVAPLNQWKGRNCFQIYNSVPVVVANLIFKGKDIFFHLDSGQGLLCEVCCLKQFALPALILVFDKPIHKHKHKILIPKLRGAAKLTTTHYKAILIIAVVLLIPFGLAQKKTDVYYNLLDSLPQDLTSTAGTQKLRDEFDMPTTHFILVSDQLSRPQMDKVLEGIRTTEGINSVMTLDKFLGAGIPEAMLPESIRSVFSAGGWKMIMANSSYTSATPAQNAQISELENRVKAIDPTALIAGEHAEEFKCRIS